MKGFRSGVAVRLVAMLNLSHPPLPNFTQITQGKSKDLRNRDRELQYTGCNKSKSGKHLTQSCKTRYSLSPKLQLQRSRLLLQSAITLHLAPSISDMITSPNVLPSKWGPGTQPLFLHSCGDELTFQPLNFLPSFFPSSF